MHDNVSLFRLGNTLNACMLFANCRLWHVEHICLLSDRACVNDVDLTALDHPDNIQVAQQLLNT